MRFFILISFLIFTFHIQSSNAATVKALKGKKVLVQTDGDNVQKGEVYFVTRDGKRVGIIKIRAVKGGKALALLGKGSAKSGDNLVLRGSKKKSEEDPKMLVKKSGEKSTIKNLKEGGYWGFVGGFSQASADVAVTGGTASLSGTGFSLKGVFDYPLFSVVWFRGMSGLEQLNAEEGSNSIEINYLTFDFWGLLKFGSASKYWIGSGFDLVFPVSKSSNVLSDSSITNTGIFAVGAGSDIQLSPTTYLPISLEYHMYPSSSDVDAQAIAIRAGYLKKF